MSIETTINIDVSREPDGFHRVADHSIAHAFDLLQSIEITGQVDDPADQQLARQAIEHFLNSVRNWNYGLYVWEAGTGLIPAPGSQVGLIRDPTALPVTDTLSWLTQSRVPWLASTLSPDGREVEIIDTGNAAPATDPSTAGDLLSAAGNWDAPVPQRIGLHVVATVDPGPQFDPINKQYVLLPLAPIDPSTVVVDQQGARVTVGDATALVQTVRSPWMVWRQDYSITDQDGFILAEAETDHDARLTRRLSTDAASLFWAAPKLIAIPSDLLNRAEVVPDRGLLALLITASLLDPVMLALKMPEVAGAEGPLTASLISVHWQATQRQSDASTGIRELIARTRWSTLRTAWQAQIATFPLLVPTTPRSDIAASVKHLLNIADQSELDRLMSSPAGGDVPRIEREVQEQWRQLATELEDEAGVERVLKRLFHDDLAPGIAARWAQSTVPQTVLDLNDQAAAAQICRQVLASWREVLDRNFNAAVAIRQAVGSVYLSALARDAFGIAQAGGSAHPSGETIRWKQMLATVASSMHSLVRLQTVIRPGAWANPLDAIVSTLWRDSNVIVGQAGLDAIAAEDAVTHQELARDLKELPGLVRRVVPDTVPQPLPIRVAPNLDDASVQAFAERYSGVAALIKRDNESWSHVNLSSLRYQNQQIEAHALVPLTLVSVDGQGAMFVDYAAAPLSSTAFEPVEGASGANQTRPPMYRLEEASYDATVGPKPVPLLNYGSSYSVSAFVLSRSGALPNILQRGGGHQAWYPKLDLSGTQPPQTTAIQYKRRTAIGKIEVDRADAGRLGARFADVEPLSLDDPRLGVSGMGAAQSGRALDLLRNRDGSGGIDLSKLAQSPILVELSDIEHLGSGELRIALCASMNGATLSSEVVSGTPTALQIKIEKDTSEGAAYVDGTMAFKTASSGLVYLRITVDGTRSMSMAVLKSEGPASYYSNDAAPPLLLLSPAEPDGGKDPIWNDGFGELACGVNLSRVGFADFDRWPHGAEVSNEFQNDLLTAYVLAAGASDDLAVRDLANRLDHLPDPAVAGYLLSVTILDSNAATAAPVASVWIDRADVSKLTLVRDARGYASLQALQKWLQDIAAESSVGLRFVAGTSVDISLDAGHRKFKRAWRVTLPGGCRALVQLQPTVADRHYGTRIDERLKDYAVGHYTHQAELMQVLPGEAILVEVMQDALAVLTPERLRELFALQAEGHERRYALLVDPSRLDPQGRRAFRLVSQCEIATQRWRYSGKPIYQWISPRQFAPTSKTDLAVLNLRSKADNEAEQIEAFERQLFFDRQDSDQHAMRCRVQASDAAQVLHVIEWGKPAATYDRHRFTVFSRYRGAMRAGARWRESFSSRPKQELDAWTMRVAVLAESSNQELTRPQLRALVPMTQNAIGIPDATPPLAAILEEPPFAFGGLAERVLAGIHTGIGYRFIAGHPTVTPYDLRHELGSDPRLSQFAPSDALARASTLQCEGPIGLHFEQSDSSVPAFVNSQLLLTPVVLQAAQYVPQESFLAVRMMRLFDPNWIVGDTSQTGGLNDARLPWIADFEADGSLQIDGKVVAGIQQDQAKQAWVVKVDQACLDVSASQGNLELIEIAVERAAALKVLHWPASERSYTLVVLAVPPARDLTALIEAGESNQQLLLAALDWSPRQRSAGQLTFEGATSVQPLRSSALTEMSWARTARNGNTVYRLGEDGLPQAIPVAELRLIRQSVAQSSGQQLHLSHWRSPRVAESIRPFEPAGSYPQTVHRHLAMILTKWSTGRGRRFDVFHSARLLRGQTLLLKEADPLSAARLLEFQVPARPVCSVDVANPAFQACYLDTRALAPASAYWIRLILRTGISDSTGIEVKTLLRGLEPKQVAGTVKPRQGVVDFYVCQRGKDWFHLNRLDAISEVGDSGLQGLELSFKVAGNAQVWADASVLPLSKPGEDGQVSQLEWDWFFGSTKVQQDSNLTKALSTENLAELREAAAQIVAYMPRIPLEAS